MEKQMVCISCPMGCRLTVTIREGAVEQVGGNICAKGPQYARQEAVNPVRVVTSLMRASNRDTPFSVKTLSPIPKAQMFDCVREIFATSPAAPLRCGNVVIRDVCGTGVDVVATQDVQ